MFEISDGRGAWVTIDIADIFLEAKILSQEEFDARFARHLIEGLTMGMVEGGALILLTSAPYPKKELG